MKANDCPLASLRITSELAAGKYIVAADDKTEIVLPHGRFQTLVTLACCLLTKPRGYAIPADFDLGDEALRKAISRLRKDIDAVLGPGVGNRLIRLMGHQTYRLKLPGGGISVDSDIEALVPHHLFRRDVDVLLRHARVCQPRVTAESAGLFYDTGVEKDSLPDRTRTEEPGDEPCDGPRRRKKRRD